MDKDLQNNLKYWLSTHLKAAIGFLPLLSLLCFAPPLPAQNLVNNPGFEEFRHLPSRMNKTGLEFERAIKYWVVPNEASTDLISPRLESRNLNTCKAHGGKNMAGIVINGDFWSEYVGISLKEPLEKGRQYYVEYWLSMPSFYSKRKPVATALNNYFGVHFDKKRYNFDKRILDGKPQVPAGPATFIEPEKWTKVSGTFIADSAHTYLYLGQFWDAVAQPELAVGYYFVDDIYVEAFKSTAIDYEPSRYYQIEGSVASVIMENIYFETDKYDLLEESYTELNKLVRILEKNPGLQLNIQGHTDDEGGERHNLTLSDNRAKTVVDYLADSGIPKSRLKSKGYGYTKPLASNTSTEGRQKNRRVEFVVSGNLSDKKSVLGPEYVYRFSDELPDTDLLSRLFTGQYDYNWNCAESMAEATKEDLQNFKSGKAKDARDILLAKVADERVILINQTASNPQGRAYLTSLLKALKEKGFDHLCLQDLSYDDKELANRAYPVLNSGLMTREPMYGQLIRTALEEGFELLPFEPKAAEMEKAMNILKRKGKSATVEATKPWARAMNLTRILKKKPAARLIVLLGEDATTLELATYFEQFASTRPFVIDQTTLSEGCVEKEHPIYRQIKVTQPSVFLKKENPIVSSSPTGRNYDLQIAHPRSWQRQGRPNWLGDYLGLQAYPFNPDKHQLGYPCLVLAYQSEEDIDHAVPLDVIELKSADDQKSLFLPKGTVTLIMKDKTQHKRLDVEL